MQHLVMDRKIHSFQFNEKVRERSRIFPWERDSIGIFSLLLQGYIRYFKNTWTILLLYGIK